ncbi:hypothetical protein FOZ76_02170 [Verticiella sediminum]|uniref:Transposase n=1 Tax=Verticiella sediminum TaxID=1247510 RepID=A0A556B091_9BURK|nr:hypothetical protein [Verticiella sediminum]TSH98580.1 hypothetical protein FOZ76_02170 [Verticiella sediminum]
MARLPRLYGPDTPHLLQARLLPPEPSQPLRVLDDWQSWVALEAERHGAAVHGWALTPEEILLLATPSDADCLRALMQGLGRRIAAQRGGGKVFAARYHSALVEPGAWVLPSLVWLENLPVRHHHAPDAEHWRWSSAHAHTGAGSPGWLTVHADYWACGNTPFERQAHYRRLLHEGLGSPAQLRIAQAVRGQWALGGPAFVARMEEAASRRVRPRPRGRPRKSAA